MNKQLEQEIKQLLSQLLTFFTNTHDLLTQINSSCAVNKIGLINIINKISQEEQLLAKQQLEEKKETEKK